LENVYGYGRPAARPFTEDGPRSASRTGRQPGGKR
jgi:hypothetical protein